MAEHFIEIHSTDELSEFLNTDFGEIRILGGGSNVLMTSDLQGVVLKNEIKGIEIVEEISSHAIVSTGGGEEWHNLVLWSLEKNLGGIENLSLIPGSVGAAPIQNIGAYGVELNDVFHHLEAVELASGKVRLFTKEDCQFAYRDSIFKRKLKGKYFITKVFLKLTKQHQLNTSYGTIKEILSQNNILNPTIKEVSRAVISIRQSKLPDPKRIGNSGSFFKNPEIEVPHCQRLRAEFPETVFYEMPNGKVKIPAGWLIEKAGWKGKRSGDAGCHENQALVLVNYGNAKGEEIRDLAFQIRASVKEMFGIELIFEVNIW